MKKMKRKHLLIAIVSLFAFASCGNNDDVLQDEKQNNEQKISKAGLTEFVMEDEAPTTTSINPGTRTTLEFAADGLKTYWTAGDKIWVDNGGSKWTASVTSDIDERLSQSVDNKTATAKFYFAGTYTAGSYRVYYTNEDISQKVNIKPSQTQATPNDPKHLANDGDCASATAQKEGGRYKFKFQHKAAYITFAPYYSKESISSVKVKSIQVKAEGNSYGNSLAGKYNFDANGNIAEGSGLQNVTLTVGGSEGFEIPMQKDYSKNAAFMVVHPGTYAGITVTYTLEDKVTNKTGSVDVKYKNVKFEAGKNLVIAEELPLPNYTALSKQIYQWDAKEPYLKGQESNPNFYLPNTDPTHPIAIPNDPETNSLANRIDSQPDNFLNIGSNSCDHNNGIPNIYEMAWYIVKGDPHYDNTMGWIYHNHLFTGGIFLKKLKELKQKGESAIEFKSDQLPSEVSEDNIKTDVVDQYYKTTPKQGPPTVNANQYFFLPALGGYSTKEHQLPDPQIPWHNARQLEGLGYGVWYWSSSGLKGNQQGSNPSHVGAGMFVADPTRVVLWSSSYRDWGYPVVKFK